MCNALENHPSPGSGMFTFIFTVENVQMGLRNYFYLVDDLKEKNSNGNHLPDMIPCKGETSGVPKAPAECSTTDVFEERQYLQKLFRVLRNDAGSRFWDWYNQNKSINLTLPEVKAKVYPAQPPGGLNTATVLTAPASTVKNRRRETHRLIRLVYVSNQTKERRSRSLSYRTLSDSHKV